MMREICKYLNGKEYEESSQHYTGCTVKDSKIEVHVWCREFDENQLTTETLPIEPIRISTGNVAFIIDNPEIRKMYDGRGNKTITLNNKYYINEEGEIGIVETEFLRKLQEPEKHPELWTDPKKVIRKRQ